VLEKAGAPSGEYPVSSPARTRYGASEAEAAGAAVEVEELDETVVLLLPHPATDTAIASTIARLDLVTLPPFLGTGEATTWASWSSGRQHS
jgi:hypothetical protein